MIEELDMHILDLVQNAIAAKAGRIDVEILCTDDRLTLRVSDDGIGMSPELLAAVEEGFYSSKSPGRSGWGYRSSRRRQSSAMGASPSRVARGEERP